MRKWFMQDGDDDDDDNDDNDDDNDDDDGGNCEIHTRLRALCCRPLTY